MARDLNKVMIIGRMGRDPEMRYTPGGRPVTTFSVAAGRTWTTADGEKRSETEWFNIVAWGGLAEICHEYLSKGQRVYIEGRLQTRRWEDANGVRKSATEIVANEMIILSQKNKSHAASSNDDGDYNDSDDYDQEIAAAEEENPF